MTILLALALSCAAAAQSAYFSGQTATLVSNSKLAGGIARDASGNLFVAIGSTIVEYTAASGYATSSTLITGLANPLYIAVDSSENIYVSDASEGTVTKYTASNSYSGTQLAVANGNFGLPYGIAVDSSNNVYVADSQNNAVKEITAASSYVTVVTLDISISSPRGLALDSSGNIFVSSTSATTLTKAAAGCSGSSCSVTSLGSNFSAPDGVAVDASGNIFVADTGNATVKELTEASGYATIETLGSGFSYPFELTADDNGNIFVMDYSLKTVSKIATQAAKLTSTTVGSSTAATATLGFTFTASGAIAAPSVLTQGATGQEFTDAGTGTCTTNGTSHSYSSGDTCTVIVKFSPKASGTRLGAVELLSGTTVVASAYLYGTGTGAQIAYLPTTTSTLGSGLSDPVSLAVDGAGNIFVGDKTNFEVKEILATGGYSTVKDLSSGSFSIPIAVALDGSGNVFVADFGNSAVYRIPAVGGYATHTKMGSGFSYPSGVAVDASGNVYVADQGNSLVKEILAAGGYSTIKTLGSGFKSPCSVAVDASGNVFVTDATSTIGVCNAVKEIVAASGYTTVKTLNSSFQCLLSLAVDANGNVYVTDINGAVYELPAAGSYATVKTLLSELTIPEGIAVDKSGNLYLALYDGTSVVKYDRADAPSFSFGSSGYGVTSSTSPKTLTIENIGNKTLSFPAPSSGTNASISSSFALGSATTCPEVSASGTAGTLAAGSSCVYAIDFVPAALGSISGSLVMTDNALSTTSTAKQTMTLTGTGTQTTQAITFDTPATQTVSTPLTLSASSTSGLAVSFTSSTTSVCTVSGVKATFLVTGTCTIKAAQAGNADYTAATAVTRSFAVKGKTQTITFAQPSSQKVGTPLTLSATSTSGLAVSFSSSTTKICTVSSGKATFLTNGTCTILAAQAGNSTWAAATDVARSIPVYKPQTITFTTPAAQTVGTPLTLAAKASSGLAASYISFQIGICTVSGSKVTFIASGTCYILASQAGNTIYAPATSVLRSFAVKGKSQTITFAQPPAQTVGTPLTLTATASSGLAVSYATQEITVCTVSGSKVTFVAAGTCYLVASQAGNTTYAAATTVARNFTVKAKSNAVAKRTDDINRPVDAKAHTTD